MATALAFVGVAAGLFGAKLQAEAQEQQLEDQEAAAEANAATARKNALIIRKESRRRAEEAAVGGEELKSTQTAIFGKTGVSPTGSVQDILTETERITQDDINAILLAGQMGSREALQEASQFAAEARSLRRARSIAPQATLISGIAGAATTASGAF